LAIVQKISPLVARTMSVCKTPPLANFFFAQIQSVVFETSLPQQTTPCAFEASLPQQKLKQVYCRGHQHSTASESCSLLLTD